MRDDQDTPLMTAFLQSFARHDDLVCLADNRPSEAILDDVDSNDWDLVRWKPAKLAVPRNDLKALRRHGSLPLLFERLAVSYAWLEVDLSVCRLFANPPSDNLTPLHDAMFADTVLNHTLLPARLIRFALAPRGCYDPICFDLTAYDGTDCPIVRVDHESILMHGRVGKRETLFDSFRSLMHAVIDAEV